MAPILFRKALKQNQQSPADDPIIVIPVSAFQCFEGHLICESCLSSQKKCPECLEDYPERRIRARSLWTDVCCSCNQKFGSKKTEKESKQILKFADNLVNESIPSNNLNQNDLLTPLQFHDVRGTLVSISNDRVKATATGSDLAHGCLSFVFFDRPIQPQEMLSIRVSMGGQKSIFVIAGFTIQDPSLSKNLPKLFNASCSIQIRDQKQNKSTINFCLNESGRVEAEADGKPVYAEQSFQSIRTVQRTQLDCCPIWAFVRLFHKNDQVEIIG